MYKPRRIDRMSYSLLTRAFSVINFNSEIIRWKSVKFRKIVSPKEIFWTKFPGFQPSIVSLFVETVSMGWLEDSGKQYIDLSLIKESLHSHKLKIIIRNLMPVFDPWEVFCSNRLSLLDFH